MGADRLVPKPLKLVASLATVLVASAALFATTAHAVTETFGFTGAEQTFVVPGGVTKLQILLVGGEGGSGSADGGLGAKVGAELDVAPGQTLYLEVGGPGRDSGVGGGASFNGGAGSGGGVSAGGGGATDIRLAPRDAALSLESRIAIAAGGGGSGGGSGGELGGDGGDAGEAGASPGNPGGEPGTAGMGGAGGNGCFGDGSDGELGIGGIGGAGQTVNAGGGGGGGLYGGGGGSGGCSGSGGGGGGGSSLVPEGGSLGLAATGAAPKIEVTYTPPPAPPIGDPVRVAPKTVLGFHPPKKIRTARKKASVKFTFSADTSGASFRCKIDRAAYAPCTSPKRFKVKPGKHRFSVLAVKDGVSDPTPATFKFKVVKAPGGS